MRTARALIVLSMLIAAGCSDGPTSPAAGRSIHVVQAGADSDTVLAMAAAPLIVQVRDRFGRPIPGVHVQFLARPAAASDSNGARRGMYVCAVQSTVCAQFSTLNYSVTFGAEDTTDSVGQARVHTQFGIVAGRASIEVSAPELGLATTVEYTTRPGSLAQIVTTAPDTAVYAGGSYGLAPYAADRFGNARTESVTTSVMTPAVITLGAGRVTAVGVGRGRVLLRAGRITDTAYVSVPPPGRLVAFGWAPDRSTRTQLTLINTDGSGRRLIASTPGDNGNALPLWTPDGGQIVFEESLDGGSGTLQVVDTLGHRRSLLTNPADFSLGIQPAFSADGSQLYFFGTRQSTGIGGIYAANADGTGSRFLFPGVQPAPSPDGSHVAYVSGSSLVVRDVATGQESTVASNPVLPRWSPRGDWIAFVSSGPRTVQIMRPDGSQLHTLGPGFHDVSLSWSPDGAWLVVTSWTSGLELIRIADGAQLPIPGTGDLTQPSWRP